MTGWKVLLAAVLAGSGLVACAGDDDAEPAAAPVTSAAAAPTSATGLPVRGDPILIEERITDARTHTGAVVDTSLLGEAPFCPGGTTSGDSDGASITETFRCPDGTLTVRFSLAQPTLVQGGTWQVVSGTGAFADMRGGGSLVAAFEEGDPDAGRVVFTGVIGR